MGANDSTTENESKLPQLTVRMDGTSGLEICAVPGKSFNCIEFTLKADHPQTILHQPWIQFESEEQRQWRAKWATEIAYRATMHESLVAKIKVLEGNINYFKNNQELNQKKLYAYFELWQKERVKYGLPEDLSDIPKEVWIKIDNIR
jgi:hypothetical protein